MARKLLQLIYKKLRIFLAIILVFGIYLYLAHFSIYYRLEQAHLQAPQRQAVYTVGDEAMTTNLVYVALGDSLTSGVGLSQYEESFPYLLAEKLAQTKKTKVVLQDFSYPGARTSHLINDQLTKALASQADIITILIGTNDVHGGISLEDFEKNYHYILAELVQKSSAQIYLLGLPNVGSNRLLLPPYNYYFRNKTKNFNQVIKNLADSYQLTYIDLESLTLDNKKGDDYYAPDLFHPRPAVYKLWAQTINVNLIK